jgi:BirA family biotin operon repressor/biotin-[acetyl-CoA-carboxylase] ligase
LWLELLKELGTVIEDFEAASFRKFQTEWNDWDVYKNKMCQIHQQDKLELEGIEKGVDENGCLLIESSGTLKKIISGDVSLRMAV